MNKKISKIQGFGKYFLFVGNAYPHKNLNRLIEAITEVNKNTSNLVVLKIVSARSVFTERLKKVVEKYHAERFVELIGYMPDNKLDGLYRNAIAFVFPSLSEGFGLPGIEALSAGTLLIASDIPAFKEIYQDNAIYFNPLKIEAIAVAMKNTLKYTPAERDRKINKAKDFVKRYSWAKMAKETLRIYEEVNKSEKESGDSLRPRQ